MLGAALATALQLTVGTAPTLHTHALAVLADSFAVAVVGTDRVGAKDAGEPRVALPVFGLTTRSAR